MLTKKDKLLIRPWIDLKYKNHRRKVQSAGPVIDFRPPTSHPHVTVKLKKTQREIERLAEIERENRRLLQRLGQIMNTSRLENFWNNPRPNFLNRDTIYKNRPKTSSQFERLDSFNAVITSTKSHSAQYSSSKADVSSLNDSEKRTGSSARCPTCSGNPFKKNQIYPEERIPWEKPKKSWNKKLTNNMSTSGHKCCSYCCS